MDNNFSWHRHIDELQAKLRKTSFALYHLRRCSSQAVVNQVYSSLGESYVRYGIAAWGSCSRIRQIQLMQNRLLKIARGRNGGSIKVLNVADIFKLVVINEYYKDKRYRVPIDHAHDTRRKRLGRFKVRRYYNTYGKYTLPSLVPILLNELPVELLNVNPDRRRKQLLKN